MAISIRAYQQGDEQKIVDLLTETFNGWPKRDLQCDPVDHWRWKFLDNPLKKCVVALATSEDRVIGCFHDIIQRIKIGEDFYLSGHGVDVATHVKYRGTGVYGKVRSHINELERNAGVEFHYGIDSNPILVKRAKRLNVGFPSSLERMARIRDVDLHLKMQPTGNALLKKYGYHGMKILNKLRTLTKTYGGPTHDFIVSEAKRFDEDYSMFWDRVRKCFNFIVSRDVDYMNWRYCDPRGGKYVIKLAKTGRQVLGYIVLRINRYDEDYPIGYIVDMLVQPDHLNVALKLVEEGMRYFDLEKINIILLNILRESLFESLLQRMGFVDVLDRSYFNIAGEGNQVVDRLRRYDGKTMHYSFGDWDPI